MLGDLTLALCVVSRFVPVGGALVVLATIPIAAIASRRRVRAAVVGGMAAATVGFLVAGTDLIITVGACTAIGTLVGFGHRREWSATRTVAGGVLAFWPPASAIALGVLALLPELRRLMLEQVRNSWTGLTNTLRDLGFEAAPRAGDEVVTWTIRYWWVTIPAALLVSIALGCFLGWFVARRILGAFDAVSDTSLLLVDDPDGPVAPVPVGLDHVSVRYGDRDALDDVSLDLAAGELVAVVGRNGSGKSTLARVLVGGQPTSGSVVREGGAGLGRFGGSAIVFQRPDAQVLGVRVGDDLRWGLPADHVVDVDGLLERVGLVGFEDRETSTLSGGELQRLAVAAALARAPRLLVSDEATSMLDPVGRSELMARFESEVARGLSVVHVTHDGGEAAAADRTIRLVAGRRVEAEGAPVRPAGRRPSRPYPARSGSGLALHGAGHVYSAGTPWAHRALEPVELEIPPSSGVLVAGHNGSGKTTLAWIIAGLLVPSEGRALLDGRPVDEVVGRVGLSFQHARLQLVERRVTAEVRAAASADEAAAEQALRRVGLDPSAFGARRVDELSGGEQRRVAVAGMLARDVSVLVLDEPFAGLDTDGREQLVETLRSLREDLGTTLVIVSHDERVADGLTERTIRLHRGSVLEDTRRGSPGWSVSG
jgi:energy-coupling factor transport system ATP-binding protein